MTDEPAPRHTVMPVSGLIDPFHGVGAEWRAYLKLVKSSSELTRY